MAKRSQKSAAQAPSLFPEETKAPEQPMFSLPGRFKAKTEPALGTVVLTDTTTGVSVRIAGSAFGSVRQTLGAFFGGENEGSSDFLATEVQDVAAAQPPAASPSAPAPPVLEVASGTTQVAKKAVPELEESATEKRMRSLAAARAGKVAKAAERAKAAAAEARREARRARKVAKAQATAEAEKSSLPQKVSAAAKVKPAQKATKGSSPGRAAKAASKPEATAAAKEELANKRRQALVAARAAKAAKKADAPKEALTAKKADAKKTEASIRTSKAAAKDIPPGWEESLKGDGYVLNFAPDPKTAEPRYAVLFGNKQVGSVHIDGRGRYEVTSEDGLFTGTVHKNMAGVHSRLYVVCKHLAS